MWNFTTGMRVIRSITKLNHNHDTATNHTNYIFNQLKHLSDTYTLNQYTTHTHTSHRTFASKVSKSSTTPAKGQSTTSTKPIIDTTIDSRANMSFLDIFKDKSHVPQSNKPDSDYPDWLYTINEPLPNAFQLNRSVFNLMPRQLQRRTLKVNRKVIIKQYNELHKKGGA